MLVFIKEVFKRNCSTDRGLPPIRKHVQDNLGAFDRYPLDSSSAKALPYRLMFFSRLEMSRAFEYNCRKPFDSRMIYWPIIVWVKDLGGILVQSALDHTHKVRVISNSYLATFGFVIQCIHRSSDSGE